MVSSEPTATAWDENLLKNPHAVADKRSRVQRMFAAIAPSYDLNNRLHSLWMDQWWRRRAVKLAELSPADRVIDVACGTGDLALCFVRKLGRVGITDIGSMSRGRASPVTAIDFTFEMLPIAREKFRRAMVVAPERVVQLINGDAQSLPLPDACADVVSIGFGIRNVADPLVAAREFHRVLRPGGRLIILEFSLPTNALLRRLYNFYFRNVLPRTATWISGDRSGAYRYLPESVNTFFGPEQMTQVMQEAGFSQVAKHPMTFGVCVCYRGVKRV